MISTLGEAGCEQTSSQTYDTPPNYDSCVAEDSPFVLQRSTERDGVGNPASDIDIGS